jgi:hypothetical protein
MRALSVLTVCLFGSSGHLTAAAELKDVAYFMISVDPLDENTAFAE